MSFWCLQFFQKTNLKTQIFAPPSLLGQKFFIHFLEELKKPNSPFEINWPLVTVKSTVEISQNFVAFSEYMNFTTYLSFSAQKFFYVSVEIAWVSC